MAINDVAERGVYNALYTPRCIKSNSVK